MFDNGHTLGVYVFELFNGGALNPFFGVVVAWALLGEALGYLDLVGVLVITLGILAVQMARVRQASAKTG